MSVHYEKVDKSIKRFIKMLPDLNTGMKLITEEIKKEYNTFDLKYLENLELESSYQQFNNWLKELIEKEPIQKNIKGINFGFFETEDGIQIYISGSYEWNKHNYDWATANDYFPEDRYPELNIVTKYMDLYKIYNDVGIYLSIAITAMFINTFVRDNLSKLSSISNEVYFTSGYDTGDLYNICKLTKKGIEIIR